MKEKGYLPHSKIKGVVFWVLTSCIVVATLIGILRSWDVVSDETMTRCLWTAVILGLGSVAFLITNFVFGDIDDLFGAVDERPPSNDPAFGERLRQAKLGAASEGESL